MKVGDRVVTLAQVRSLFGNFNIDESQFDDCISFDVYSKLMDTCMAWYGEDFMCWLQDCFIPTGEPVCPGYEDSCSFYYFGFDSWNEFENVLNKYTPG